MSLSRRLMLLNYARESGAWIVEDDYDSEFRYRGQPLPALSALDSERSVFYVGTFSKSMFAAMRIGCRSRLRQSRHHFHGRNSATSAAGKDSLLCQVAAGAMVL